MGHLRSTIIGDTICRWARAGAGGCRARGDDGWANKEKGERKMEGTPVAGVSNQARLRRKGRLLFRTPAPKQPNPQPTPPTDMRHTMPTPHTRRTLEFCGAETVRLNHIGDWGTQFGMLIQHMSELRPEGLGAEGGRDEDVSDLMELYRWAVQLLCTAAVHAGGC